MHHDQTQSSQRGGFTLLELAIVLVIIGLIIGGVLVGQDMIRGAEIRSTAGQLEKYHATVHTFRDKYRNVPGDIDATSAARFGFASRAGTPGHGDGNGQIEGCATFSSTAGCETVLFWRDLSTANLLTDTLTIATDAQVTAATAPVVRQYLPEAKIGRANLISAYAFRGLNYYQIGAVSSIAAGVPVTAVSLTPQEAFNIDGKTDDGLPMTGTIRAADGNGGAYNVTTDNGGIVNTACASLTEYNVSAQPAAGTIACHLRARFQ